MIKTLHFGGIAVIIIGVIIGFSNYQVEVGDHFTVSSYPILFGWILGGFVSGTLLMGLGEIIDRQREANEIADKNRLQLNELNQNLRKTLNSN